jgi:hypothetical protein
LSYCISFFLLRLLSEFRFAALLSPRERFHQLSQVIKFGPDFLVPFNWRLNEMRLLEFRFLAHRAVPGSGFGSESVLFFPVKPPQMFPAGAIVKRFPLSPVRAIARVAHKYSDLGDSADSHLERMITNG